MDRAFLDAYNRELALLYEGAKEFAEDYPGIAERLGGLTQDNLDPAVAGLLEGAAFMAARVQLKLDTEAGYRVRNLHQRVAGTASAELHGADARRRSGAGRTQLCR